MSELETKQPSEELLLLIKGWTESYIKSKELPSQIMEKAEEEGFTKAEIRKMVEGALDNIED